MLEKWKWFLYQILHFTQAKPTIIDENVSLIIFRFLLNKPACLFPKYFPSRRLSILLAYKFNAACLIDTSDWCPPLQLVEVLSEWASTFYALEFSRDITHCLKMNWKKLSRFQFKSFFCYSFSFSINVNIYFITAACTYYVKTLHQKGFSSIVTNFAISKCTHLAYYRFWKR